MVVTLSSAENALKSFYLDAVSEQLNNQINPFLAMINKTSSDVWGKDIKKPVMFGINGGFKSGYEVDYLPKPDGTKYTQFTLPLKNFYGTIEISDKAIRASENNTGAFVNLLNAEMESLIQACSWNFGRMLFGDGSGKLATVKKIDKDGWIKVDNVRNLIEGLIVDFIFCKDDIVLAENKQIISVDKTNNAIKISGMGAGFNTDVFKGAIITVQGSFNKELTGLEAIFSKKDELYGLDRTKNKWLNPYIKEKQGVITEDAIQKAIDHLAENYGSGINYILCSYGVRRALGDVREFNGIPIITDRFCPEGTLYLLNTDDFELCQLCDWVWLEQGDGRILHQVPGKPIYTATLVKYADLICSRPWAQGKISGIIEE